MSGHSKWSQIKHKKAATDKKKGAAFSKLAAAISVAAREGGGDPTSNFRLRLAIDKAREANMPNENVERAIKKGTGEDGGASIEQITYEGFGPEGVAIIIECATDNKNRTLSEIKHVFSENNGTFANEGAVAYQFEPKGMITIKKPDQTETLELELIDIGAEDFVESGEDLIIYTSPASFGKVKNVITEKGFNIVQADLVKEPKNTIQISNKEIAQKTLKLVDELESQEDVLAIYSNFDISEDILNELN